MITRFIDTNIFLEAYARAGERSDKCQKLLTSTNGLSTSWVVIGEFEWVLRSVYKLGREKIAKLLTSLINLDNIEIANKKTLSQALKIFKDSNIDWTDCLNTAFMFSEGQEEIYSYDHDFDKISGVKRLEP